MNLNDLKRQAKPKGIGAILLIAFGIVAALYTNVYSARMKKADEAVAKLKDIQEKVEGVKKLNDELQKKLIEEEKDLVEQAKIAASQNPKILLLKQYKDPAFADVAAFLNAATRTEFTSGVKIKSLHYKTPEQKGGYDATTFVMMVSGRFSAVLEFLEKLETAPALVALESVKLNIDKSDTSQVTLDLSGIFYRIEDSNA